MPDRTDRFANLAVIVMCVVIAAVGAKQLLPTKASRPAKPNPYVVGEKTPFVEANFGESDKTVLLVVSSTCRFCTESLPFYRGLIAEVHKSERSVRAVVASLDPPDRAQAYVSENGLVGAGLIRMPADAWVRIQATPTVLVLDREGIVKGSWVGKLQPEQEKEVPASLGVSK